MTTFTLYPTGPGDLTEFPSQFPASGAHWDKVDTTDTDYISRTGAGVKTDLFSISPTLLGGKINSVSIKVTALTSGGTNVHHVFGVLKTNSIVYPHDTYQELQSAYTEHTFAWTTNPNTSSQWSWSEIYNLQIGVKIDPQTTTGLSSQVTLLCLSVDYTVENVKSNFAVGDCGVF